jgi:uncharacterized protein
MVLSYAYAPINFFVIIFLSTWTFWFTAAYLSYLRNRESMQFICMIAGLLAPCITALIMIHGSKILLGDFYKRLSIYAVKMEFVPLIVLLMPCTVFLATAISLLFGFSVNQFFISDKYDVWKGRTAGFSILIIFLASLFEELAWRGYGVDSIYAYCNLFNTSMIFAFLWALWHLPLFFVKDYYHYNLWHTNLIYVVNYFLSIIPVTILLNWMYYENNRSISVAIIFHFMINLFSVCFQTEQFTKCIITILLFMVSIFIIMSNKSLFF